MDNKISSCTYYVAFGTTDCEIIKGSLRCYSYIVIGYLYNCEVIEQHFQTINYKYKRIKAKILKFVRSTYKL